MFTATEFQKCLKWVGYQSSIHVVMPDYLTHNPPTDSMPQMFLNNSLEKPLVGSHAFW